MSQKFEVPITNKKALETAWILYAVAQVKEVLAEKGKGVTAPGFALAVAIVDAEYADARAHLAGAVIREAARAGHDVGKSLSVNTSFAKGNPIVVIEMPDLGDIEP